MKRKIIKQAGQAYTITLPIEWIRTNNIKEGDEIDLQEEGKSILINSSSNHQIRKKIRLNAQDLRSRTIYNSIVTLYASGFDDIELISDKDITPSINKTLTQLIGFGLTEQKNNSYIIKDLGLSEYQNLDEIIKRVFQMILLFYENTKNDIFGKQEEDLDGLRLRDVEVNKLCVYLQRAINKKSYPDAIKGRVLFTLSFALEQISDEVERLWRTNIKYNPKKSKEISNLLELSQECLGKSFDLCFQFNPKISEEIYSIREKVREDSMKIKTKDSNSLRMVRHIVKIAEEAADLTYLNFMLNNN